MRSIIRANPLARAATAFLVGGLAVLVVHQPVVGLLHALGSTPIMPYSLRATQPWGIPVFLSLSFWGGIWTIPIAWVLDRLPRGWVYWVGALGLGALPPTLTTWFVIFPLKGLSPSNVAASVGLVNALTVNGIWGLAIAFAWPSAMQQKHRDDNQKTFPPASRYPHTAPRKNVNPQEVSHEDPIAGRHGSGAGGKQSDTGGRASSGENPRAAIAGMRKR